MGKDFTNKDWAERIEDIKNNLYLGGGKGQADSLIATMLSPYGKNFGQSDIDVHTTLTSISAQIRSLKQTVLSGGIVPIKIFENSFKRTIQNYMPYACLDNDLKFCVKHYGEKDWKNIKYVFPYMHTTTAFDVSFGYDNPFVPDI